jgi:hypothetical protein
LTKTLEQVVVGNPQVVLARSVDLPPEQTVVEAYTAIAE